MAADEELSEGLRLGVVAPTPALRAGLGALLNDIHAVAEVYDFGAVPEFTSLNSDVDILLVVPGPGVDQTSIQDNASLQEIPILLLVEDGGGFEGYFSDFGGRVWGVLSLEAAPEELEAAINALAAGLVVGLPTILNPRLRDLPTGLDENLIDPLTDRELQVLQLLAKGRSNKEIALALDISTHTVKFHISGIYTKLGATNRTEAVRLGFRQGLIVL
jgi:DNA-binding CsgD family transcriptional regulator